MPQKRPRSHELNALLGLVGIALIFEILGWIFQGQSFLFNTQRLSIMILQVSVVGIIAIGVTQVIITGGVHDMDDIDLSPQIGEMIDKIDPEIRQKIERERFTFTAGIE